MYKILIVSYKKENIPSIRHKQKIKYIKPEQMIYELTNKEYDLIYVSNECNIQQVKDNILADYMLLPIALKKLAINGCINNTYVNLQILNKLLIDNVEKIKFENYCEEMTMLQILKIMLVNQAELKEVMHNIEQNKIISKKNVQQMIKQIIYRNLLSNNYLKRFKYKIHPRKMEKLFFACILDQIYNDIDIMKEL